MKTFTLFLVFTGSLLLSGCAHNYYGVTICEGMEVTLWNQSTFSPRVLIGRFYSAGGAVKDNANLMGNMNMGMSVTDWLNSASKEQQKISDPKTEEENVYRNRYGIFSSCGNSFGLFVGKQTTGYDVKNTKAQAELEAAKKEE